MRKAENFFGYQGKWKAGKTEHELVTTDHFVSLIINAKQNLWLYI